MSGKVWVISDLHFGHENCCTKFKKKDGSPLRPYQSAKEMDEAIVENWNSVVREGDNVLVLGDVAMCAKSFDYNMPKLLGRKYLIRGNHDVFSEGRYQRYFSRILGVYVRDNFAFTHVPIHPDSGSRWLGNVHGHVHSNTLDDPFYINCSVENIGFTPVDFEEIKEFRKSKPEEIFRRDL